MAKHLTAADARAATRRVPWALGDDLLYELCRNHPHHKDGEVIWTKMTFIGRVYAAAVERRKKFIGMKTDMFFADKLLPRVLGSGIDRWIRDAKRTTPGTPPALRAAVDAHGELVNLLHPLTGIAKRSFAAKYLHFHLPDHVYIYDSVSAAALAQRRVRVPPGAVPVGGTDQTYAKFATRCAELARQCESKFGITLTPRQIDYLLLDVARLQSGKGM